jgi:DNA modification methylase
MKTEKDDLRRDKLPAALKEKLRSRRKASTQQSEMAAACRPRRNDMLPLLKVETCSVDAFKSPARKLRKSDSVHIREIADSISTLGFNVPLLIGKNDVVLDGETRLEAAKLLGLASVPCIRVDHLDDTEQRLLRIAVNRLGEKGSWDFGELKVEFEELIIADAPIEISGFGADEIDQIVIGPDQDEPQAAVLLPPAGSTAIARMGDLFLLGPHRVICGNAGDPDLVKRLMRADVARTVFTDAPFHVATDVPVSVSDHREDATVSAEMTEADFLVFNQNWMKAVFSYLVNGGLLGTFIDWRMLSIVNAAATALGLAPIDLVVLATTSVGAGSLYGSQHKLLPLFKKGLAAHVNNISPGKRGRDRTNLWTYPDSLGSDARRGRQGHPMAQSAAMLEDALIDLTHAGEIVLDPFLGSGSTLIAAQNTGRVCCGVEIDPLHVDVIIRQYEALTGIAAILADNETSEQVASGPNGERGHH